MSESASRAEKRPVHISSRLLRPFVRSARLIAGSVLVTVLALAAMGYLMVSGERMVQTYASVVDAAIKVKLEASLAHLWFEEQLAGDQTEGQEQAWDHLARADDYAAGLAKDIQAGQGRWPEEAARSSERLLRQLSELRLIGELRTSTSAPAIAGTDLDRQFDAVFREFLVEADRIETLLQRSVELALTRFRQTGYFLMGFTILFSIFMTLILQQLARRQRGHFEALRDAADTIREQNRSLNKLAHFDALTGLPNRPMFLGQLDRALRQSNENGGHNVLFFVDLDNFKAINDSMGHHVGDLVITEVADRLQHCVRGNDVVARLAGDEFTVLLAHLRDEEQALATATRIARNIIAAVARPFLPEGQEALLSCSVGIAVHPRDGDSTQDLLRHADTAMYHAKALGKNTFQFFTADMNERVQARIQVESGLRKALREDQFLVHWQPQWTVDGRLRGCEALLRWAVPNQGVLLPTRFIDVAESSGLISAIGDWTLESACHQYRVWRDRGLDPGILSANLSALQFRRDGLVERILRLLESHGIEPQRVELELTESVLMYQGERSLEKLRALDQAGLSIAIDDFGTGYSSMAYLHTFPVSTLKIDRSFVSRMDRDASAAAIVDTVLSLARHLRLETIAEGVETEEQRQQLILGGCDYLQGYLLGRPTDAVGIEALLKPGAGVAGGHHRAGLHH